MTPAGAGSGWVELRVRAPAAELEAVADLVSDLAPAGVSIEPAILASDRADFEYRSLDTPGLVRAYFAAAPAPAALAALRARLATLGAAPLEFEAAPLEEHDWAEEWKRFYRVVHAGERFVIRPSWEPYDAAPGEVVIDLDPGAAFGTGQHETTLLCLAALDRELRPGARVLDLGTGSGILAIAAARAGAGDVSALDLDPAVIPVACDNIDRNAVGERVRLAAGSLGDGWPWSDPPGGFDLALANISSTVLVALMPALAAALVPGGTLIASGFVAEGAPGVEAAARAAGLTPARIEAAGEWCCLVAAAAG